MLEEIRRYLLSSSVVGGLIIWYFQKQITKVKAEKTEREKQEIQYRKLTNDFQKATGALVFWLHKGIDELDRNHEAFKQDFEKAYLEFKQAEHALREFEQDIFAQQKY